MVDKSRLLELAKENKKLGFTDKQIKKSMLEAGLDSKAVDEIIYQISKKSPFDSFLSMFQSTKPKSSEKPYSKPVKTEFKKSKPSFKLPEKKYIIAGISILFVLIFLVYLGSIYLVQPSVNINRLDTVTVDEVEEQETTSDITQEQTEQTSIQEEVLDATPPIDEEVTLTLNQTHTFNLKEEQHSITLDKINGKEITFTVKSIPQSYKLIEGSTVDVDVDGDILDDLSVQLIKVQTSEVLLSIKEIIKIQHILECVKDTECDDGLNTTRDFCNFSANYKDSYCVNQLIADLNDSCQNHSDCDDGEVWTRDICSGDPKKCTHSVFTDCISGDNYCPLGCTYDSDTDCGGAQNLTCANLSGTICDYDSTCVVGSVFDEQEDMLSVNDTEYCCPGGTNCIYGDFLFNGYNIYITTGQGDTYIFFNLTSSFTIPITNLYATISVSDIEQGDYLTYNNNFTNDNISIKPGLNSLGIKYCESECGEINLTDKKIKVDFDSTNKVKEVSEINNYLEAFAIRVIG